MSTTRTTSKAIKVPASVTRANFIKSNYVRRYQLTNRYGFVTMYEFEQFLKRREKRNRNKTMNSFN